MELDASVNAAVPGAGARVDASFGGTVLLVEHARIEPVLRFLRDDPEHGFDMLVDVTAVDFTATEGRIHILYVLRCLARNSRVLVKTAVSSERPELGSAALLWKSANWGEREVWDMFGVRFIGHPDLRRILMYEEFEGHPLLKAYPYDKRQPLVEERDPIGDPWPSRDGL